jgi:tagaturonate reductase
MTDLPETVLQFGSGKFLRGFADLFLHQANCAGQRVGRIVVVQSTGAGRADALAQQKGRYHVLIRGMENGQVVDRIEESASISRAVSAAAQWPTALEIASSPRLKYILSNTAEEGYQLDAADRANSAPPKSFPAKLLQVLQVRSEAGQAGVSVIPCELFEHNADKLRGLVLQLAGKWQLSDTVRRFIERECVWVNTLVDRIVSGTPRQHSLLAEDGLLIEAEPFAFWAVETRDPRFQFFQHPAVHSVPDVMPYFLRKVRILNAAHTALVNKCRGKPFVTVRDAVTNAEVLQWLRHLIFDEIVPTLGQRAPDAVRFGEQTLERFQNPFLEHKLADIAAYHEAKVRIRLMTTRDEYRAQFGREPVYLTEAIGA